jgi:hypothetical protein
MINDDIVVFNWIERLLNDQKIECDRIYSALVQRGILIPERNSRNITCKTLGIRRIPKNIRQY